MATLSYNLSSKVDVNGMAQLYIRITLSKKNRPRLKTGIFARQNWFDPVRGIIPPKKGRLNTTDVVEANKAAAILAEYESRLTKICSIFGDSTDKDTLAEAMEATKGIAVENLDADIIMKAIKANQINNEGDTFFGLMESYIVKSNFSAEHTKGYRVLMRMLARYQSFVRLTQKERKGFTFDIDKTTKEDIEDFFDYVRNEKALSEEYPFIFERLLTEYPAEITPKHNRKSIGDRGTNTIYKLKKKIKAFFNWLIEQGYTTNQPCKGLEIKAETYGTPYYLTLEERNLVADYDLSEYPSLAIQRDIFIFQCLVGCRVSDLIQMIPSNISGGILEYIPRKTIKEDATKVRVPLNGRATALVEKYKGVDTKGRLFPFISAQKYNEAIKAVLTKCEVNRLVTVLNPTTGKQEQRPINELASSHMARRTFIGNLYRQVKDPNLIGSMSGHVDGSRAFARYRAIDDETKKEIITLID